MRYFINLSFNGTPFSGWQIQKNAVSVQGELQNAISTLLKEPITITGAGRTDSGVNAINYIAHFDTKNALKAELFIYKINAILPKEISVNSISEVSEEMHARFSAISRTYKYYIHIKKNPFSKDFSYYFPYKNLDINKMNEAALHFIGEHDFACLQKAHSDVKTTICNVTEAFWEPLNTTKQQFSSDFVFTVSANRFLRNMVRAMVGTLLEVGTGKKDPNWIPLLLKSKNRCMAGNSVPGNALFLTEIKY